MPIAVETLKRLGVYDEKRVLGVTTLDVVSAVSYIHCHGAASVALWGWLQPAWLALNCPGMPARSHSE